MSHESLVLIDRVLREIEYGLIEMLECEEQTLRQSS
jgi:hypothetical protein